MIKLSTKRSSSEIKRLISALKMGTTEWAKRNCNIFVGCNNNCYYCYARNNSHRMAHSKSELHRKNRRKYEDWGINAEINWAVVNKGFQKVKSEKGKYDYMFQSSSDLFENTENYPYYDAILTTLTKILASGNSVLITTKPRSHVIKNLCEDLEKFKKQIGFRFTIGSINNKILSKLEPNAPNLNERLKSAKIALDNEYPTTFSVEPLLDKEPYKLVDKLIPLLSTLDLEMDRGTIWLGLFKSKYTPKWAIEKYGLGNIYDKIKQEQEFEHVFKWYKHYYDNKIIRFKESVKKMMIINNIKVRM